MERSSGLADAEHVATMRRYGGDWQPLLDEFADAVAALKLPDTAWAVLSCPIDGMDLEPDFADLIDRDADGRVRTDDVRAAIEWTASMLDSWQGVTEGRDTLRLADLSSYAQSHCRTALALAGTLGLDGDLEFTLGDLRNTEALCQCGDRDGDGVVPVHCLPLELREPAKDILSVCPPETDRHGNEGVTKALLVQFAQARSSYLEWVAQTADHHPWGEDSVALALAVLRCDAPVSAWFTLSQLAKVDTATANNIDRLHARPANDVRIAQDPVALRAFIDNMALAAPTPNGCLDFHRIRPGTHSQELALLRAHVFDGAKSITLEDWRHVVRMAQAVDQWSQLGEALAAKPLGAERVRALDDSVLESLRMRCELDEQNKQYFEHLQALENLLIYQRDLFEFCRNFVSFTDLMDPTKRALFERGTVVLAGREFHFAMRVRDLKEHKKRAEESGIFVFYAQIALRWRIEDEPVLETVAVPVTRGTSAGVRVRRRGVFIDRGRHYHEAVVIDIVENPVSLTEALFAPFGRIGQYLSGKLEKLTEKLDGDFDKQVANISKAPPAPATGGMNPLMGGTVAFAALGSAFAFITKQLTEIGGPRILFALIALSVLVAIPTLVLASLRLYRRNLAGLISASDWALNDQMRLTPSLGRLFTRRPRLPPAVVARTRDYALEKLKQVDPGAAVRARIAMLIRGLTITTMTTLLLAIALPTIHLPWLDQATWAAAAVHISLLAFVLINYTLTRRFRAAYWWPVLTSFPVAILVSVYFLTTYPK